ncbi:MAG: YoaK family protein [bacterium]|nr:YoaK family protein [bacterium]
MKHSRQMSESLELGIVLALSGGFMDAYSYLCRDHVFANAQTGNMLLLGVNLAEGNWNTALRYGCPVLAFAIGIALADIVRIRLNELSRVHWRQIAVVCEALVLLLVSIIPLSMNLLANSLTSLACGIQVESFRKIRGNGIATTMCIGNLRSATQNICEYWYTKDKKAVRKGILYYGIILCFVTGAVIGNACIHIWGVKAIRVCSLMLGIAVLMMFIDREKQE